MIVDENGDRIMGITNGETVPGEKKHYYNGPAAVIRSMKDVLRRLKIDISGGNSDELYEY
jgi:hypothetical protein